MMTAAAGGGVEVVGGVVIVVYDNCTAMTDGVDGRFGVHCTDGDHDCDDLVRV